MGVPTSEVGYTSATTGRGDHEVRLFSCIINRRIYQYKETNVMHLSFSLLRIKGLYMFRAILAHPQEALHKRYLVYCMRIMSVGCGKVAVKLQPWFSTNWMKSASCWFRYTDILWCTVRKTLRRKYAVQYYMLMWYHTLPHVSVRMNHHQAFIFTTEIRFSMQFEQLNVFVCLWGAVYALCRTCTDLRVKTNSLTIILG
jgi:hypothetical protein